MDDGELYLKRREGAQHYNLKAPHIHRRQQTQFLHQPTTPGSALEKSHLQRTDALEQQSDQTPTDTDFREQMPGTSRRSFSSLI